MKRFSPARRTPPGRTEDLIAAAAAAESLRIAIPGLESRHLVAASPVAAPPAPPAPPAAKLLYFRPHAKP
jgi:hypothetical protein